MNPKNEASEWAKLVSETNEAEKIEHFLNALSMEVNYNIYSDGKISLLRYKLKDYKERGIEFSSSRIPSENILSLVSKNEFVGPKYSKNPLWYESLGIDNEMIRYASIYQFIEFRKAITFFDSLMGNQILNSTEIDVIMPLGEKVKRFDENIWIHKCVDICLEAIELLYTQSEKWRKELKSSKGRLLIEEIQIPLWGNKKSTYSLRDAMNLSLTNINNLYGILLSMQAIEN